MNNLKTKPLPSEMESSCYIARIYDFNHQLIQDVFHIRGYEAKINHTGPEEEMQLNFSDDSRRIPKEYFDLEDILRNENVKFAVLFRMNVRLKEDKDSYKAKLSILSIDSQEFIDLVKEAVSFNFKLRDVQDYQSKEDLFKASFKKILKVLKDDEQAHQDFVESLDLNLLRISTDYLDNLELSGYRTLFNKVASVLLESLAALQALLPVDQWEYKDPSTLKFPTNQISREPFFRNLNEAEIKANAIEQVSSFMPSVQKRKPLNEANAYLILTIPNEEVIRNLDLFDYAVYSAYYTSRKVYGNSVITFEDLAKLLPHKANSNTKTPRRFLKEIEDSINFMRNLDAEFDFTDQVENQAASNPKLKDLKKYSMKGHLIEAQIQTVRTKRSAYETKGLVPLENSNSILFDYSEAMNEFATIPVKMLETPVNLNKENAKIHLYLAYQIANMPFNSKRKLLSSWPARKSSDLALTPDKDRTITVKGILESCRIDIPNTAYGRNKRSRILNYVEEILNYWKESGIIKDYKVVKEKGSKFKYIIIPI